MDRLLYLNGCEGGADIKLHPLPYSLGIFSLFFIPSRRSSLGKASSLVTSSSSRGKGVGCEVVISGLGSCEYVISIDGSRLADSRWLEPACHTNSPGIPVFSFPGSIIEQGSHAYTDLPVETTSHLCQSQVGVIEVLLLLGSTISRCGIHWPGRLITLILLSIPHII